MNRRDQEIIDGMLPHLVHNLVKKRVITDRSIKNPKRLFSLFRRHIDTSVRELSVVVSLHEEFAAQAYDMWKRGKKLPAIVLFTTAVEQVLNIHHRNSLLAKGFDNEEITSIIRSQNIDSKLSWLLGISGGARLPRNLKIRLRILFDIRNSIVHYKAVPGLLDKGDDSSSAIRRRIKELGRVSLKSDFEQLDTFLYEQLFKADPGRQLASAAYTLIKSEWNKHRIAKAKEGKPKETGAAATR